MNKQTSNGWLSLALLSLFLVVPQVQATTVTIDFDAVAVSPSTGTADPSSYLAGFGVSLSQTYTVSGTNPNPAQLQVTDDRWVYTGWTGSGPDPVLYLQAPSPHNVFSQAGNNGPITFTLYFASPLSSFSFASVGIGSAPQATSFPAWAADAFDASNGVLDSVGQGFAVNRTTSTLTLSASDYLIDHVTFYRDGTHGTASQNGTAYSHVILDDLVLTQADTPEPVTLVLLGVGLAGFGFGARRRQQP